MRYLGLTLCLLMCFAAPARADSYVDVQRVFDDWMKSFSSKSGEVMAQYYWNDATIVSPLVPSRITAHNVALDHFNKLLALPNVKIVMNDYTIRLFEGAALISGQYTLGYDVEKTPTSIQLRFTMVLMRKADYWKILEDHTSAVPPPE